MQTALQLAQFRTMIRASRVFLSLMIIDFALVGAILWQSLPPWIALSGPCYVVLHCLNELLFFYKLDPQTISDDDLGDVIARCAKRAVTSVVISLIWGVVLTLTAPIEIIRFMVPMAGFAALGTAVYIGYLRNAVVAVLTLIGLWMATTCVMHRDAFGLALSLIYASNAFIVGRYLFGHFESIQSTVENALQAESRAEAAERAEAEIARVANTDFLTGIANRRGLLAEMDARIVEGRPFALGAIDLDGFKPVNDCYGHAAGDRVLVECAARLQHLVGQHGVVARLGGDEFALLILDDIAVETLKALGSKIGEAIRKPIAVVDEMAQVAASCGFATFPAGADNALALLERADQALYEAKQSARGSAVIYDIATQKNVIREANLQQKLRRAVMADELFLDFQPVWCTTTKRLLSYEALARWQDGENGRISPAEFIPIAEACGLICELSGSLFRKALSVAVTWPSDIGLAFNLSAGRLSDPGIALRILADLEAAKFRPSRLTIEITETALMAKPETARLIIDTLRAAGIKIALDDFGTGYSGFANLHLYPVDILKLDRTFVANCIDDVRKQHIVAAIVEMSKRINLFCVAEGIETEAELALVTEVGCDAVQGYLLGRPAAPDQLPHLQQQTREKISKAS